MFQSPIQDESVEVGISQSRNLLVLILTRSKVIDVLGALASTQVTFSAIFSRVKIILMFLCLKDFNNKAGLCEQNTIQICLIGFVE